MTPTQLSNYFKGRGPLIHVVLDGWGLAPASRYNAISLARTPVMDWLIGHYPNTRLLTHGPHVGLPSCQDLGGSEVGHMTMGSGEILEQGSTYIKRLIDTGEFNKRPALAVLIKNSLAHKTPLHLIGLLSDGNIHSHIDHFVAVIRHAFKMGVEQLYVHALLDGRDTPIQSALIYTQQLEKVFHQCKQQNPKIDYAFASGAGREQMTMDRDKNWTKIEAGWNVHVRGESSHYFQSITAAIHSLRKQKIGIMDQHLPGFVLTRDGQSIGPIRDHHSVIFMNFRADRALEFSEAMINDDFPHFDRSPRPKVTYAGMMAYNQETQFPAHHLVAATHVDNPFGKRILEHGLTQFRLTESQKFPHVTFFYNGGYHQPIDASVEKYLMIESDKIASFDLRPVMKAVEIEQQALQLIASKQYDYGLINFANADMVGHSGNLSATIVAVEAVDRALGGIVKRIKQSTGLLIITADHGNADQMSCYNKKVGLWEPDTKHTLNPVPFIIYDPLYKNNYQLKQMTDLQTLNLSQIAATNFILMGLSAPSDINESLFQF